MRVYIPRQLNARTMYIVLGQILDEAGAFRTNRFTFDFQQTSHIDSVGFVMLDSVLLRMAAMQCQGRPEPGKALAPASHRLLIRLFETASGQRLHAPLYLAAAPHAFPIRGAFHRVDIAGAEAWIPRVLDIWLARTLYTSSLDMAHQTYGFVDLLYNVQRHAGVSMASIVMVHEMEHRLIRFILSDAGFGIPNTVRRRTRESCTDSVCIVSALEGKSYVEGAEKHAGGLGKLVHEIVDRRLGEVTVSSAEARVKVRPGTNGRVYLFEPAHACYPGTLIEIAVPALSFRPAYMFNEPQTEPRFFVIREY